MVILPFFFDRPKIIFFSFRFLFKKSTILYASGLSINSKVAFTASFSCFYINLSQITIVHPRGRNGIVI
jgi:hypothetical protein